MSREKGVWMCQIAIDNRLFFIPFMVMLLMACLGFRMGLYVHRDTQMDKRLTQADNNMVNYATPRRYRDMIKKFFSNRPLFSK